MYQDQKYMHAKQHSHITKGYVAGISPHTHTHTAQLIGLRVWMGMRAKNSNFPYLSLAQTCSIDPSETHLQSKGMDL